jgi:DsbC/DsbD-like thiol-disulfide interchange protein
MSKRSTHACATIGILLLSSCNPQAREFARQEQAVRPTSQSGLVAEDRPTSAATKSISPVTVAAKTDRSELHAGDAVTLIVDVRTAEGWHIYAIDRPTGPALPTEITIELPKGWEWVGTWKSPEPLLEESSSGAPRFVHEGSLAFRRQVRVGRDAPSGPLTLHGTLSYQACDRFSCRPPEQVGFQAEIRVVN